MNKSLSVFLSVLLCVVLYVGVLLLRYTTDESNTWQSGQVHTSSASAGAPSVSFGVGANGDVLAVPMSSCCSSREQYLQSSWRSTGVADLQGFSRSANSTGMLSRPSLQGGDGGRLFTHMSSSQTMKSFGGGSNTGVSMSGGVVSNSASSLGSGVSVGIQSPIAYTQLPTINTQSPIASNYQGVDNTTTTAPRGMRGRRGVGSMGSIGGGTTGEGYSGIENSWLSWLANSGLGYSGSQVDGSYGFNIYQLQDAYDAWLQWWISTEMGGETPDEYPSFDEFLSWFWKNDGQHTWSGGPDSSISMHWVPVGDVLPLLVLAMLYVVIFFVRRNKTIQL